ncbi:MAG: hypothetical protein EAZ97_06350 [Bacteroidetes bacterium]|nr:MAG: hypothetical protein EAZ97_06350 [Bacteroidota bacterium]
MIDKIFNMETANFKDWTLSKLDDAFGIRQIWTSETLKKWQNIQIDITENETENLLMLQASLIRGGKAWNEVELENKFISPIVMLARIDDEEMGYFLERPLKAVVGNYELSGIVDGVIATGFRDPKKPFFCMHEYKRSVENSGNPDAQALAAMLVVQKLNDNQKPVYGLYIVGLIWNFMVLEGDKYCVSKDYTSDSEDIFAVFRMLKALKQIIKTELM